MHAETLELIYDESLLPAPAGCGEQWQQRAVSTSEAGSWLRSLLSKRLGEIDYTTIHTLKSTPLSWCAKAGLSEPTRLMLGHHVTGKHSADVYARDVLAAPLREFDTVLQQIRNGALRPDATRSGMLSAPSQEDPKDTFAVEESRVPDEEDQSSSSESDSCSDESHSGLVEPNDPAADDRWDPDFDMFQHKKSKIVHVRAVGSQQKTFSCGVRETKDFEQVKSVDFLVFRKCKRCTTAKPLKDVGALASALKKRRLELESKKVPHSSESSLFTIHEQTPSGEETKCFSCCLGCSKEQKQRCKITGSMSFPKYICPKTFTFSHLRGTHHIIHWILK